MSKPAAGGSHPPPGTLIDDNSLRLVEVIGSGGYGVVYRAVETSAPPGQEPRTFAVKCLRADGRRSAHIREATLHHAVSSHPNVIKFHQIFEEDKYMYFVLELATSHDLFHHILNEKKYLGRDDLIKSVFLQLIDAVDHCHSMNIYHRDLKPENILCFNGGALVAITDFGLATTDETSVEFRTGSIYHMSPECQSGSYQQDAYCPMYNDVWSLGIILLNIVTGRNPWKCAVPTDPVFQSYLRSPFNFFSSVLPVSSAMNKLLIQVLDPNWRNRMPLRRFRRAVEKMKTFYSSNVVFEGNLARCSWEVPVQTKADVPVEKPAVRRRPAPPPQATKPAAAKEPAPDRRPVPPIPQGVKPSQPDLERLMRRPVPPPPARKPPAEVKKPVRRPVPLTPAGVEPYKVPVTPTTEKKGDDGLDNAPLKDSDALSRSATLDDASTSYSSEISSLSSGPSFPKTPDNHIFMKTRAKKAADVALAASTQASPADSIDRRTCDSSFTLDGPNSYIDLTFSSQPKTADQTMLSPSPSQYSLQEACGYSIWSNSNEVLARSCSGGLIARSSSGIVPYPEIQTPAPSKPIDIVGARPRYERRVSRSNFFNPSPYVIRANNNNNIATGYIPHPSTRHLHGAPVQPGRVAVLKQAWEGILPQKPMHNYAGTYVPNGRHWI